MHEALASSLSVRAKLRQAACGALSRGLHMLIGTFRDALPLFSGIACLARNLSGVRHNVILFEEVAREDE